jgi:adiponectin receptor
MSFVYKTDSGQRFIPPNRWPLILSSLFALHNETRMFFYSCISLRFVKLPIVNIYTHLIPFVLWTISSIPFFGLSSLSDTPETTFTASALICLLFSTVWHTMSGCAHARGMEFCARVDYVGIGWYAVTSIYLFTQYIYLILTLVGSSVLALELWSITVSGVIRMLANVSSLSVFLQV